MEFGSRNSIWDDTINIFNQRLSWKEKKANDFECAKNPQGGIVKKEAPIHVSNLSLIDPKSKEATKVGFCRSYEGIVKSRDFVYFFNIYFWENDLLKYT